jgi:hypothetical protein
LPVPQDIVLFDKKEPDDERGARQRIYDADNVRKSFCPRAEIEFIRQPALRPKAR